MSQFLKINFFPIYTHPVGFVSRENMTNAGWIVGSIACASLTAGEYQGLHRLLPWIRLLADNLLCQGFTFLHQWAMIFSSLADCRASQTRATPDSCYYNVWIPPLAVYSVLWEFRPCVVLTQGNSLYVTNQPLFLLSIQRLAVHVRLPSHYRLRTSSPMVNRKWLEQKLLFLWAGEMAPWLTHLLTSVLCIYSGCL